MNTTHQRTMIIATANGERRTPELLQVGQLCIQKEQQKRKKKKKKEQSQKIL